ncbi:MAG TPA: flagellar biosynthetic protein FliP, partial [Desulfurobacteriaceae bacterium]|nr:flagellar biosynthetic protein FliP [Desulfurobacteriaceae bacterium]
LRNTRKDDLALFLSISNIKLKKVTPETVPLLVLIPAYMVSEIRTALEIVFLIYLPFFVIDVIVATILMAMGMMMIPPMMISLPFKILLLVVSNGLEYLIRALIETYK